MKFKKHGFTLAEVLITLGVIGVVSAMTLPVVLNKINDMHFKVAYKKAYSDLSQVVQRALQEDEMPYRNQRDDEFATTAEWAVFKKYLKVTKECTPSELSSCWADGEKLFVSNPKTGVSESFIDSSGRSWAEFDQIRNIYLVDINGFKAPNRFGKDRFMLTLKGNNQSRINIGIPTGVTIVQKDIPNIDTNWCPSGACYYHSWLYE